MVDPAKEPPGQSDAEFYTVKAGDNLSKIAKEHYGDANKYPAVFEANKPQAKQPLQHPPFRAPCRGCLSRE